VKNTGGAITLERFRKVGRVNKVVTTPKGTVLVNYHVCDRLSICPPYHKDEPVNFRRIKKLARGSLERVQQHT